MARPQCDSAGMEISATKESREYRAETTEKFIREHPGQSALAAMGVGFLIAQLPLRYIAAVFIKIALMVLKPVAVVYSVARLFEDFRGNEGWRPGEHQSAHSGSQAPMPATEPAPAAARGKTGGKAEAKQGVTPEPAPGTTQIQLQSERK